MKIGQRIRYKGKPARVERVDQRATWVRLDGAEKLQRAAAADITPFKVDPRTERRDAMILAAIETEALDRYAIAAKVHAGARYILDCLTRLHTTNPKRIFIRRWRTHTGTPVPLYQAGDDPDTRRPVPRTTREQNRIGHARYREKVPPKPHQVPRNHALVRTGTVVYTSRPAAGRRAARAAWDALIGSAPIVSLRLARGEWIALRQDGTDDRVANSF